MHARVPNHHPRTTFHTVSLGTSVNEAKMKGRGPPPRPSSLPPDGLLLRAGDRSQVLVVVVEALECALCLDIGPTSWLSATLILEVLLPLNSAAVVPLILLCLIATSVPPKRFMP